MIENDAAASELEATVIPWQMQGSEQAERLRKVHARGALASAEGFLRRSARAGAARPGLERAGLEEAGGQGAALLRWARKNGRLIDRQLTQRLVSIGGVEHETFHEASSGRWIKLTHPGKAGKELRARCEAVGVRPTLATEDALPLSYLRRLILANKHLGDDFCLHGVIAAPGGARLVISQRHVAGIAATPPEVARHFTTAGFRQITEKAFYHVGANLLVSDAHSANVFKTPEGATVPFDVGVQQPRDSLRYAVSPAPALDFEDDPQPTLGY